MFKFINLIPTKSGIEFLKRKKAGFILSFIILTLSFITLFTNTLNFGIDFAGGINIEVSSKEKSLSLSDMREELKEFNPTLQKIEDTGAVSIRLTQTDEENQIETVNEIKNVLGNRVEYRNVESVGPKVGKKLIKDGLYAVIFALLAISFYIWIRFELPFALSALTALAHDIIITLGLFSITGLEFNLTTVAAVLTIAGYSINDTVVSFDRVRENLRKYRKMPIPDLLNLSINETLSRTILTSVTTFLAVAAIFLFGGEVLRSFSFAMLFGVIIGTYSSICIAVPMLTYFEIRDNK
jgi:preprotein translocase SecF subunit